MFLGLLFCNVGLAECADGVIDETKLIGGEHADGSSIEHGNKAVSCEGIEMYYSANEKRYVTKEEWPNQEVLKFTDVESAEPYSGHKIIDSDGFPEYYSIKQKKYISCKKFNREEGQILNPEKKEELFYGGQPICHGHELELDGRIQVYDAKNGIWIPKPTLSERIQKHISSELIEGLIGLIIVLAVFRYRHQVRKSISSLFSKIKSPFSKIKSSKKDWKRIMLTLSILYLCIMYYLNWWGHQGGMFIYKMTYSWFLRWGLIPVVSGWIIYYIWRKEK
jgi:hypothetical protein